MPIRENARTNRYPLFRVIRKYKIKISNCSKLSDLAIWSSMTKDDIINTLIEQAHKNATETLQKGENDEA